MAITEFRPPRADGEPDHAAKPAKPATPSAEPALRWDDRLRLGVDEIDNQHKALIGYCSDLVEALRQGRGQEAVADLVNRLREYAVSHFAAEERYMERIRYPGLERQRQAHAGLMRTVKEYQRQLYQKRAPGPDEVRKFLKDWLIGHILGEDLKIAEFLAGRGAAPAAPGPGPAED